MTGLKTRLKRSWKFILAIIVPLILLPVLFVEDDEVFPGPGENSNETSTGDPEDGSSGGEEEDNYNPTFSHKKSPKFKLAYVILVMAVYWALELIPLPITSLFPLVLFPLLGIDDSADVSTSYMKESNTIFLGGAIVALAVEFCNLHHRVALRLITIVGVSPRKLMFGIMAVVSFLSMWISATTCTTMLVPIIAAIVDEIHEVTDATNADVEGNSPTAYRGSIPGNLILQHTNEQIRAPPGTSSNQHRRASAFANSALSSHHTNAQENDDHRGTLGVLEGHRSMRVRDRSYPRTTRRMSSPGPRNNNRILTSRPEQLPHLSGAREELESADRTNVNRDTFSFENVSPSGNVESIVTESGQSEMDCPTPTSSECNADLERRQNEEKEKWRKIKNMYLFALAYSANIGGTATITGTGPNKVFKEVIKPYSYDISQDGKYLEMTFFTWMAFNVPPMLVNNLVAWIYLNIKYCGFPKLSKSPQHKAEHALKRWKEKQVRSYLIEEYKKLGKMTWHEIGVAIVFLLVVFLWILRDPQMFKGWYKVASEETKTGDSTPALLGAVLLFIVPRNWAFLTSKGDARFEALLDWSFVTKKLPWGVLLLLGSGYAIGDSVVRTGLSRWIGKELFLLHDLPDPLLLLIVMLITAFITEVVSNTACASIILPVLLGLSREMGIHPLYLSVAAAVTASYAFMLPVASPVNAIAFAAGDFSIWEMISNGYILNGICVLVFYINTLTLGQCMFDYSEFSYPPPSRPLPGSMEDQLVEVVNATTGNYF